MKIAVVGTGYVGLVTGTCFANSGNDVVCIDINQVKIERLKQGIIPIYEPGLTELVQDNVEAGRLRFTTEFKEGIEGADVVFLAVGTPQSDDGAADLTYLWSAADAIVPHLSESAVVVTKSTVPVGTNGKLFARLNEATGRTCSVASNPEFLKEGAAIEDFTKPDRVVVGVRSERDAAILHHLYAPFLRTDKPFLVMSPESAEMTKYAANALLATKISFINHISNICDHFGADINEVRRGIAHDSRIGFAFLFPGVGYGGSCFPKDVRALICSAREANVEPQILEAVDRVNEQQKRVMQTKLVEQFGSELKNKRIAVWGLAFKPKTDDIREAPALVLLDFLIEAGADVVAFDPEAMQNVKEIYGSKIKFADGAMSALEKADALVIMTEWTPFRTPNFKEMQKRMAQTIIFDGRNLYSPAEMKQLGFTYYSIGRPTVR